MKNLKKLVTFWASMVRFGPPILLTPIFNLKLYLVHLLSRIFYNRVDSFSIQSFLLQYESFFIIGFINELDSSLLILFLVVFVFTK